MNTDALERLATAGAYLLVGLLGTAAVALALLYAGQPVQAALYRGTYWWLGPGEATEAAILGQFVAAGVLAVAASALLGEYISAGGRNLAALGKALGGLALLLVAFAVASLAGLAPFTAVVAVLGVGLLAVPVALRYWFGVRSGGVLAFVGGLPVLFVLLLLVGFGLGWGWGYVVTATEVPDSAVGDAPVADLGEVPAVREDLFARSGCDRLPDGARRCMLQLRGYEHELAATRFLARHGVRCPYQNAGGAGGGSTFVRHEGTYYRVSCTPHGD